MIVWFIYCVLKAIYEYVWDVSAWDKVTADLLRDLLIAAIHYNIV